MKERLQGKIVSFAENDDNSRFVKCKLKLMHDGQSKNRTQFTKETMVECVEATVRNTPILCHVYKDNDGNYKIGNHDVDYSFEQNEEDDFELVVNHLEKPVGFIPESTEIWCEEEDSRTYIYVYGLLWKHYMDKLNDILLDKDCISNISTELYCNDAEMTDDNILDIKKFELMGTTIISAETGMHNTVGEFYFSSEDTMTVEDMQTAYNEELRGGEEENMNENKGKVVENSVEEQEEPQAKKPEVEEPELEFSLSCSDIREQIWNCLSDITVETTDYWGDIYTTTQYCLYDLIPDDKIAIVCDYSDKCKMFGVPYLVDGDTVKLDFEGKKAYICEWRPMNEGEQQVEFAEDSKVKEHIVEKFNSLKFESDKAKEQVVELSEKLDDMKDYEELKQFKLQSDKVEYEKQVNEVTAKFGLEDEEIAELKEKVMNQEMEVKAYEKELAYMFAMKKLAEQNEQTFSKKEEEKEEMPQIDDNGGSDDEPYGGLFNELLNK